MSISQEQEEEAGISQEQEEEADGFWPRAILSKMKEEKRVPAGAR